MTTFTKKTFWEFFVKNYKFTFILVLSAVAFGLIAMIGMPKESDPEVEIPIGVVTTPFPGASVEDVEELITNKIEDRLNALDDVEQISSNSSQGISSITVEFSADADIDASIDDLKEQVDLAKIELPTQAEDPIVQKISLSDTPFVSFVVSGPFSIPELKVYADLIKDEIESLPGMSTVQVFGGQEREVQVVVRKADLDEKGLEISQITRAISQANSDIPIGSIETGGEIFSVRFAGRLLDAQAVRLVPVGSADGTPILVQDVATVFDGYAQQSTKSNLGIAGPSEPAVTLRLFKSSGGDIVRLSDQAFEIIERLEEDTLPEQITVVASLNMAEMIRDDLNNLGSNALVTVLIVSGLLVFFIGWREAVMAAVSIPLAFLITFIWLDALGLTINFMTLFSLILALGILVDSTIVVNEGLSKRIKAGDDPETAAIQTIREFQYPLISGTLTTVFAFVPMLLTGGIIGEYIKTIPLTVTGVLMASLFVALAVITSFTVVLAKFEQKRSLNKPAKKKETSIQFFSGMFDRIRSYYSRVMNDLLRQKGKRKTIKRVLVVILIATYALPFLGFLRVEMFPPTDAENFSIDVELPFGTPLEQTSAVLADLETRLYDDTRLESFVVNAGYSAGLGSTSGGGQGEHLGNIFINLKPKGKERKVNSFVVLEEYQAMLAHYPDAKVTISQESGGPPSGAPVEIKITGNDINTLEQLGNEFEALVESVDGAINVDSNVVRTNGQFVIYLNRAAAQRYGVTATDVAMILRNAINGSDATEIRLDGEDVDVSVRYGLGQDAFAVDANRSQIDIAAIESITINTPAGDVPLSSMASIQLENSRASIAHLDGDRIVTVTSDVRSDKTALDVFAQVEARLDEVAVPAGYTVSMGGEDESTQESFADLMRAMIVAVILIASLMVLQFKSFRQSIFILTTIPLALTGVFPGLTLVNQPISFPGVIGIVALAGIVVNNAIILIDKINSNREAGMPLLEAIEEGATSRVEPIILTTITTVFGMLPLAITQPLWASLGYSIIFGLIASTFLTLLVLPLMYRKFYKKEL